MLAHKSTTTVAYFALRQSFISLALSIIFHEVLSLKSKAQCILAHVCLNSVLSHLPSFLVTGFQAYFQNQHQHQYHTLMNTCMILFYDYEKRLNYTNSEFSDKGTTVTNITCRSSCSDKARWVCPFPGLKWDPPQAKGKHSDYFTQAAILSLKLHDS